MADTDSALRKKIQAVQRNENFTPQQKAQAMQALMSSKWNANNHTNKEAAETLKIGPIEKKQSGILDDDALKCVFCSDLCSRPVTAPCQHNFCLDCFGKWTAKGNIACPTCRSKLPTAFMSNPRINTALTIAIRIARQGDRPTKAEVARVANHDKPEEAYVTERAQRAGRANAASGKILVTVPGDHFGPIGPESDPQEGKGVYVGRWWNDRMDCRQWGAHFPHVAGISGQSKRGAQSVVLSGGYEDDRDEGDWFLYTGSGGRDLSGNKRTAKLQSFDQEFEKMNLALKVSCIKGLPVRVVRSFKEKRSAYAPPGETPVRYDGIYRIAASWRKAGTQNLLMCRYLFVRCDNEPAPWSSEATGDRPTSAIPTEAKKEMKVANGPIVYMAADPWWDWSAEAERWQWMRPPPPTAVSAAESGDVKKRKQASQNLRALKEFSCAICKEVLREPLVMPCSHKFCRQCLLAKFAAIGELEENNHGRATRPKLTKKPCPCCSADCAPFLKAPQVNTEMENVIARLQAAAKLEQESEAASASGSASVDAPLPSEADADVVADLTPSSPAAGKAARQQGPRSPSAPQLPQSTVISDAEALAEEFPGFDAELISGLLQDQGGDVRDVRQCLQKMKNVAANVERKAARASRSSGAKAQAADLKPRSSARGLSKRSDSVTNPSTKAKKGAARGSPKTTRQLPVKRPQRWLSVSKAAVGPVTDGP